MTFQTILSEQRMDTIIDAITLKEEVTVDDGRPDMPILPIRQKPHGGCSRCRDQEED